MKKCELRNMRLLAALVVGMMLFASCAKDEVVAPCGSHEENSAAKSASLLPPTTTPDPPSGLGDEGNNGRGKGDPDTGPSISDDGDDLSDKERSNKKKAN